MNTLQTDTGHIDTWTPAPFMARFVCDDCGYRGPARPGQTSEDARYLAGRDALIHRHPRESGSKT